MAPTNVDRIVSEVETEYVFNNTHYSQFKQFANMLMLNDIGGAEHLNSNTAKPFLFVS